jgi:hypothetical protein
MKRLLAISLVAGCGSNPEYLPSPMNLEAGMDMVTEAKSSLTLPIKPETMQAMNDRARLAMSLGLTLDDVPYVKIGDMDIEIEWSIKNLDDTPGQAKIELDGANEVMAYDPTLINLFPGDDEAPPTPGLAGNEPINVPASGRIEGKFREDELLEAAIDLDAITRGNHNPFNATLTTQKRDTQFELDTMPNFMTPTCMQNPDDPSCQAMGTGMFIPRAAFRGLIRIDLVFRPTTHMVLDYTVRIRDNRGILHDEGLSAPMTEIVAFMPMDYTI